MEPYTITSNDEFKEIPLDGYQYFRSERVSASEIISETRDGNPHHFGIVMRMESEPTIGETRYALARVAFDNGQVVAGAYRVRTHILNSDGAPVEASRFTSHIIYPAGFWEPVLTRAPFRHKIHREEAPRVLSVYAIDGFVVHDPSE